MRSYEEEEAIKVVLGYGNFYGYGNLISCLKREWAKRLVSFYDFTLESATLAANTDGFSEREILAFDRGEITLDDLLSF